MGAVNHHLDPARLPQHVAIIMDGNGRWATARGLPRTAGHEAGARRLEEIAEVAGNLGIPFLTVFAFSTENWQRPAAEVNALFHLAQKSILAQLARLQEQGVQLRLMGYRKRLPPWLVKTFEEAEAATRDLSRLTLSIAFDYGGRADLVQAIRRLSALVTRGSLRPEQIDEATVARYLWTADLPDPDLLIRTGGQYRVSNFLLWNIAYTELWVTDCLWPDFGQQQFLDALADYERRQRRFGGIESPVP
ncbi:MAG: di-trans,poly-cis-decaprenylcistransferase [Limnochordaceae bacterium]|nr:di-trans,poly-cis-decaprenylcistransferase [Limnochordaceae bacterium]